MIKIDIRDNVAAVKADIDRLRADISERAIASALNKTAEQGRTRMIREISREFAITAGEVRGTLRLSRARPGAGTGRLIAELAPLTKKRGRGFNVIRFLERKVSLAEGRRRAKAGTLRQLGFQIKRGGGTKRIAGVFIGNKGRTVFVREGRARLPIKAVTTIDVAQMFNTRRINGVVVAFIQQKFPELLARELQYFASRQR